MRAPDPAAPQGAETASPTLPTDLALSQLGRRLNERVGIAGAVVVDHPAERRLLQNLSRRELASFARAHGLNVVRRIGGRIFEFTRFCEGPP